MTSSNIPKRGEVWIVDLNPTRGAEMQKQRTAVVLSCDGIGKLPLHIIVPITEWQPSFAATHWFQKLVPNKKNGLSKDSGADSLGPLCRPRALPETNRRSRRGPGGGDRLSRRAVHRA